MTTTDKFMFAFCILWLVAIAAFDLVQFLKSRADNKDFNDSKGGYDDE